MSTEEKSDLPSNTNISITSLEDLQNIQRQTLEATEKKVRIELERVELEKKLIGEQEKTRQEVLKQIKSAEYSSDLLSQVLRKILVITSRIEDIHKTSTITTSIFQTQVELNRVLITFLLTKTSNIEDSESLKKLLEKINDIDKTIVINTIGNIDSENDVNIKGR